MNLYPNLKFRYQIVTKGIAVGGVLISAGPTYYAAMLLADTLGIPTHGPVIEHPNGWFWLIGFLALGAAFLLAGAAIVTAMIAAYFMSQRKWTAGDCIEVLWRNRFPPSWYK